MKANKVTLDDAGIAGPFRTGRHRPGRIGFEIVPLMADSVTWNNEQTDRRGIAGWDLGRVSGERGS